VFFIGAATYSYILADLIKPLFLPFLDDIAYLISYILSALSIKSYVYQSGGVPIISLATMSGKTVLTSFVYGCIGVFSAIVFSIILVIILFEDSRGWKIRVLASVVGIVGTFGLNIVRVIGIFLTDYFYGAEVGAIVHYFIGYVFFSVWLTLFLYAYFKTKTMKIKIPSMSRQVESNVSNP
jgi:exosortase/archaeosortase family protein